MSYISQKQFRAAASNAKRRIKDVPLKDLPYLERIRKPVDISSARPDLQKYLAKLHEGQRK